MIRIAPLEAHGGIVAAMSGRADGDARCAFPTDSGCENRARLLKSLGLDQSRAVYCEQVHGNRVAVVKAGMAGAGTSEATPAVPRTDGLVTILPGVPLCIAIADCVPIFLFDPVRRACGVLHAGRQGTLLNIAGEGVAKMTRLLGSSAKDICAHIGPSAGPDSYEVSPELAESFRASGLIANGRLLDLWASNALLLEKAGLLSERITLSKVCTIVDTEYFSYRRGDVTARNMGVVALST